MFETSRRDLVLSAAGAYAAFGLNKPGAFTSAAHAQQPASQPTPSTWTPIQNGSMVNLFGAEYEAECGPNAIFRNGNAIKFILRPGDIGWPDDMPGNPEGHRAELDGYKQTMPAGQSFWSAGAFYLDPGASLASSWQFLWQYHAAYNMRTSQAGTSLQFQLQNGSVIGSVRAVRSKVYQFVNNIVPGTAGSIKTWVDGVQVVNYTRPVVVGRYPKIGIYRIKTTANPLTLRYDNFEFGAADLSSRITNPLPQTPGWLI